MISKSTVNLIAILIILGYILTVLFGKYLGVPIWDLLYTHDPLTMNLKTHLIFAIKPLISLFVPIIYATILFNYSKHYQTNPLVWAALGLVKGPLAIVLFALIILYQNQEIDITKLRTKFKQIMIWFLVLLLVGIVINFLNNATLPILSRFLSYEEYAHYNMLSRLEVITLTIYISVVNIAVAVWIYNETNKKTELSVLWVFFALFSGLLAPIMFIIFNLIKYKMNDNTATNNV